MVGLCIATSRRAHELKNAAYETADLLGQIEVQEARRLSLLTQCYREGSPALLIKRSEEMQLALVHPLLDARPSDAGDVIPGGRVRVASPTKRAQPGFALARR